MSQHSKVAWTEGMFIRPQHFQQQDRYLEYVIRARAEVAQSYGFGFQQVKLDNSLLAVGKIALESGQGFFSDGTYFDCPAEQALPAPLNIPEGCSNEIIYLALPLHQQIRYTLKERAVFDETSSEMDTASISLAELRPQLLLGKENTEQFTLLPLAKIVR
jgi:type VI secretion system protein ImpJ